MLAGMRLLATDLDGTLVFHHAVGQADAEALVRWSVDKPIGSSST